MTNQTEPLPIQPNGLIELDAITQSHVALFIAGTSNDCEAAEFWELLHETPTEQEQQLSHFVKLTVCGKDIWFQRTPQ